jgi:ribosomal protein L40E
MPTPAQDFQKWLKEAYAKFLKTPWTIPVAVGLSALVFYLMLLYMITTCLVTLIPPFFLWGILYVFKVKDIKKLIVVGAIGCFLMMLVAIGFFVVQLQTFDLTEATSSNGVLEDGRIDPRLGDSSTLYNFTLTVNLDRNDTLVSDVRAVVSGLDHEINQTMNLLNRNETVASYYYLTTISDPINYYRFIATVNGTTLIAQDHLEGGDAWMIGPIASNWVDVAMPLFYITGIWLFAQFFFMYFLMVGMVWWTRRAKKSREEQLHKWSEAKEKAHAESPKDESKVPSLAKAMGLDKEDTFVCSECGADVPADATKCPKCGEKFD